MPPWCNFWGYLNGCVVSYSCTIRGKISLESIDLGGAENVWCCLDLEFLELVKMMSSIKH